MRLIDADAFKAALGVNPLECPGCPEAEWTAEVIELLDEAPEAVKLEQDGTLCVLVEDCKKVKRVLVLEDGSFYGALYSA